MSGFPGHWELIILIGVGLLIFGLPLFLTMSLVFVFLKKKVGHESKCPGCQNTISVDAAFCSSCGCKLVPPVDGDKQVSNEKE